MKKGEHRKVKQVRVTLTGGDTKVVDTRTTSEKYLRKLFRDLEFSVEKWEVLPCH